MNTARATEIATAIASAIAAAAGVNLSTINTASIVSAIVGPEASRPAAWPAHPARSTVKNGVVTGE